MKTTAAVLYEINKPLKIEELTVPELKAGQVLVKIEFSGICHSQLNEIHAIKGEDKFLPHTLGHEASGIVEAIGTGVNKVKPGDRVVLTWIKGSGADVPSTIYKKGDGSNVNSGAITTFMTRAVISENRLVKIPDKMPLREAALLGCAVPTGAGMLLNTLKVKEGDTVAIFGVGGVGLSAVIAADLLNCSKIIAVDVNEYKLKLAEEFGATHKLNPKSSDVVASIKEISGGKGVDHAIESAGVKEAMEAAFNSIKDTGTVVIAGNIKFNEKICINPYDLIKGKRIIGTWGGETKPDADIPFYVEKYLSGKLKLEKLITHEYKLSEINKALNDLENGKVGRALIGLH